jgi:hypothetical protein
MGSSMFIHILLVRWRVDALDTAIPKNINTPHMKKERVKAWRESERTEKCWWHLKHV